jgi:hypothetical protein
MTWGKQNTEAEAHEQLSYAFDYGLNFMDTAGQAHTQKVVGAGAACLVHRTLSHLGVKWLGTCLQCSRPIQAPQTAAIAIALVLPVEQVARKAVTGNESSQWQQ